MKTSVIEVSEMLSVLNVLGLEKQIGAVPEIESVTVSFARGGGAPKCIMTKPGLI